MQKLKFSKYVIEIVILIKYKDNDGKVHVHVLSNWCQ